MHRGRKAAPECKAGPECRHGKKRYLDRPVSVFRSGFRKLKMVDPVLRGKSPEASLQRSGETDEPEISGEVGMRQSRTRWGREMGTGGRVVNGSRL